MRKMIWTREDFKEIIGRIAEVMVEETLNIWGIIYQGFGWPDRFKNEMEKLSRQYERGYIPKEIQEHINFGGGLRKFVLENLFSGLKLALPGYNADPDTIMGKLKIEILKESMRRDKNLENFVRSLIQGGETLGEENFKRHPENEPDWKPGWGHGNFIYSNENKIKKLILED